MTRIRFKGFPRYDVAGVSARLTGAPLGTEANVGPPGPLSTQCHTAPREGCFDRSRTPTECRVPGERLRERNAVRQALGRCLEPRGPGSSRFERVRKFASGALARPGQGRLHTSAACARDGSGGAAVLVCTPSRPVGSAAVMSAQGVDARTRGVTRAVSGNARIAMRSSAQLLLGVLGVFALAPRAADAATIAGTVAGPDGTAFRGAFVQARNAKT